MSRLIEITLEVKLPDLSLDQVEFAATDVCDEIIAIERTLGIELGPTCQVNSRTHAAIVRFTCESSLLMRIGQVLIDSEREGV